jgi:hypothetical protein
MELFRHNIIAARESQFYGITRQGFLRNNEELLILQNGTAKHARDAKLFEVHFANFAGWAVQNSRLTLT